MYKLKNTVQPYAWGSTDGIPSVIGVENPDRIAMAELWMGAHPIAPSQIVAPDALGDLARAIATDPAYTLGEYCVSRFGPRLPFLFKVLSAAKALSIQAHPSRRQAIDGYAREEAAGLAIDAPNRNYRDDNHKPEIIRAITRFEALRGFKPIDEIRADWQALRDACLDNPAAAATIDRIREPLDAPVETEAARRFFEALVTVSASDRLHVIKLAERIAKVRDGLHWSVVARLIDEYPGDVGTLAPLFLNYVVLEPGEALYLPAGVLHAYLSGTGIELMANSDNVLRCGCTPKHIDVDELLSVVVFDPGPPDVLTAASDGAVEAVYDTTAEEFELSMIVLDGDEHTPRRERTPEIVLTVDGSVTLRYLDAPVNDPRLRGLNELHLVRGDAVFLPAGAPDYAISGSGSAFRAHTPRR